jgi:hypothetical protein
MTPNDASDVDFSGMLGCAEMEWAAKRMLRKIVTRDDWQTPVEVQDFIGDEDELDGFCMLLHFGWMEEGDSNGSFRVGKELAEKMKERLK